MNREDAKSKIEQLTQELREHNYKYYVLAEPSISDREFDQRLKDLESLENQFPEFKYPDSPSVVVGGGITKNFDTVNHSVPMLSLSNTYNREELEDFDVARKTTCGHFEENIFTSVIHLC